MSLDRLSAILTEALTITDGLKAVAPPVAQPPLLPQEGNKARLLASGVTHEYATFYPGSINHKAFLFQYQGGAFGLHYPDGRLFKMLPSFVNTSSQPRWSRKKPTVFRYLWLNELREFDVATDQSTTLRKFDKFPNVNGMGESDTSEDDDHTILCSGLKVFVYQISADKIVREFVATYAFNNLYLTSQNEPIVGYNRETGLGHMLYRSNSHAVPVTTKELPHMDTSSDAAGNPIAVFANGVGNKFNVTKTDINTGQRTDLIELDWSLAIHVSLPDRAKFAIVTTYDPKNPNSTKMFANEILKVALDGSGARSLGKHGSNSATYLGQPKASVSPDGSTVLWDSNGSVYARAL